jgi:hypothetical protein
MILKNKVYLIKSNHSILCFSPLLGNDGRTNETILQELSEKHKQKLADEKSKFQDLTAILDDYKVEIPLRLNYSDRFHFP